ncbi:uncharacterized protein ASPGLDRAFT_51692 [Aspergillus glaucus CBS 516.65]|uniref:Uncharacterized protein n=1 Tax=Aspergillus glaucus CBS 516.65 TaxID=1160497 RepID=A0A1L9V879_ASPGL|nr:hypothetical protein ASPGLDRAFT_51692 [Aspergillus glaucus CBS 516.65]OJJ80126.1 hypothetical protein ASPGLDRAFT_51692 [Aspergillus glaucus CBS 516.65]
MESPDPSDGGGIYASSPPETSGDPANLPQEPRTATTRDHPMELGQNTSKEHQEPLEKPKQAPWTSVTRAKGGSGIPKRTQPRRAAAPQSTEQSMRKWTSVLAEDLKSSLEEQLHGTIQAQEPSLAAQTHPYIWGFSWSIFISLYRSIRTHQFLKF